MKLRAIGDKIIIKKMNIEKKSAGGIILLENEKTTQFFEGEIINVGVGNYVNGHIFPFEVKVGDKVLFVKHGGVHIEANNENLVIAKECDILAKLDENENLIPIGDILLCERAKNITSTKSGIIVSMGRGIQQDKALVLKMGKGRYTMNGTYENYGIKVDDMVYFDSNRGIGIDWKLKPYLFLGMTTVIATSNKEDDIEKENNLQ